MPRFTGTATPAAVVLVSTHSAIVSLFRCPVPHSGKPPATAGTSFGLVGIENG
ncbi:MAG TPA: hypothetical protein PL039_05430 [Kiritimatiellia bacterium]|nr:hypothetical protein [Kiritimatiellia bacterium]